MLHSSSQTDKNITLIGFLILFFNHMSCLSCYSCSYAKLLLLFTARPELEVGEVGSPREDSLLPTDKQRKKIEKERGGITGGFLKIRCCTVEFDPCFYQYFKAI